MKDVISEMLLFAITLSSQGLHCLYDISHFFDIVHVCICILKTTCVYIHCGKVSSL